MAVRAACQIQIKESKKKKKLIHTYIQKKINVHKERKKER
jgi:hypothetical protein